MTQQDALAQQAYNLGERLALLLASSNLPDEAKAGFAAMIPEMTPKQIDRLINLLEQNVQNSANAQDKKLLQELRDAQTQLKQDRQKAQQEALAGLDKIEQVLKQAEEQTKE